MRQPFTSGALGRALIALVAAFALVLPSATFALVPAEFDAAVGEGETTAIESAVSHSKAQAQDGGAVTPEREPTWGDYFTYTYTWEANNLNEAGTEQGPLELRVNFPVGAKPTSDVTSADFTVPAGWTVEVTKGSDTNYTVTVTPAAGAKSGTVKLNKQARIPAKDEEGAPADAATLWASSAAETSATPNISLTEGEYFFRGDNGESVACSGVFQFQWKVNAGAWMADIKFGDAAGRGKIVLDDAQLVAGDGPNSIKVTDANGVDITSDVVGKMTWNPNDSSEPYQPNPFAARYPNMKWLQSANWKIDTSTYTGDTWLPAGSTVTVKKHGRHENCVAGIATDWQTSRPLEALMEVTRPVMGTSSNAVDTIQLPGTPEQSGNWCDNELFYTDLVTNKIPADFGRIKLNVNDQDAVDIEMIAIAATPRSGDITVPITDGVGAYYRTVAASPNFPNELYFWGTRTGNAGFSGLIKYNRETKELTSITTYGGLGTSGNALPLGFDPDDRLWGAIGRDCAFGALAYSDFKYWTQGASTWIEGPRVETGIASSQIYDVTFDVDGNAYVILDFAHSIGGTIFRPSIAKRGEVWKFSKAQWEAGGTLKKGNAETVVILGDGNGHRGLAWGPGGKLYAAQYSGDGLYEISFFKDDGQPAAEPSVRKLPINSRRSQETGVDRHNPTSLRQPANDLAGCSFGEPAPPSGPKFQVQKSVIDPVTGAVVEPGKAAPNPVAMDSGHNVTVNYVVSVSNVGTVAGTPSQISDTLTVPQGFTITDVLVDGTSKGASGSFTLTPGELPAGGVQTYRVTLKMKTDVETADWAVAETCGDMSGQYGGGFYNAVTMEGDSDGPENNYACVPTTPSAQIALKKFIRTPQGPVTGSDPLRFDAQYFTLGASLVGGGVQKTGQSPESGKPAVNSTVPAGTYQLFETPNDNGKHTGKYQWGTQWSCVDTTHAKPYPKVEVSADNQVVVKPGQCVTCEIHNQPPTLVHIEKFPVESVGTNPHIGSAMTPDADGKFEAKYKIVVTNTSSFMINTGAIRDHFKVPAGLVWDPDKPKARVSYQVATYNTGGIPNTANPGSGFPKSFTQADLASDEGALITESIKQLGEGQTATFIVTIPLQLDNTPAEGGKTNAQKHLEELGNCESLTTNGASHTSRKQGIANAVDLDNEDLTYNQIPILDNIACVPVIVPPPPPPVIPELPALPLTGGGSARDLFILGGLVVMLGGIASLLVRQMRVRSAVHADDA